MGQLSGDGRWWWDGSEWRTVQTSSGLSWFWDGTAWQPVPRDAQAARHGSPGGRERTEGSPAPLAELDDARFGEGKLPTHVLRLPGKPTTQLSYVAIGSGWVARRIVQWHPLVFPEIQAAALVAPERKSAIGGSTAGSLPELALQSYFGKALRIEVAQMTESARKDILTQLPAAAYVTELAEEYLEDAKLPSGWGERLTALGVR
jgi:hypothetical protein